jgi:hypothetical protein
MADKHAPQPVSALADSIATLAVEQNCASEENTGAEPETTTEAAGETAHTNGAIDSYGTTPYHDDPNAAFAQTASADDLFFDDDVVPVAQPVVEQPVPETLVPVAPELKQNGHGGYGGSKRGGGNRGRGGNFNNYKNNGKVQRDDAATAAKSTSPEASAKDPLTSEDTGTKPHVPAVSGNRLLTGGPPRKPKLSEDSPQLAAIMAAAAKKNAARIAQFEREQADLAESEAREAQAAQRNEELKKKRAEKAKIERQNRLEMMGEREKNARRKLAAAQGREWDREKEEGFTGNMETKKPAVMRGMHGGVVSSAPAPKVLEKKEELVSLPSPAAEGASWADQVEGN